MKLGENKRLAKLVVDLPQHFGIRLFEDRQRVEGGAAGIV